MSRKLFFTWAAPLSVAAAATLFAPVIQAQAAPAAPSRPPTTAPAAPAAPATPAQPPASAPDAPAAPDAPGETREADPADAAPSRAEQAAAGPMLTEGKIVATAVAKNPDLKASVLELESAQWAVVSEEARYVAVLLADGGFTRTESPNLSVSGSGTRETLSADANVELRKSFVWGTDVSVRVGGSWQLGLSQQQQVIAGGNLGPTYGMYARASVVQPLLRGAGREVGEAELLAARVRRTSAEQARDRTASELLRSVVTAYWELWYASEAAGIQEQSRTLAVRQRDDALLRVKTGSLAPADALSFETRVATRDEDVLNARVETQRRQLDLSQQLGGAESGDALGLPSEDVPPIPPIPPDDVEEAAVAASPQLRELETSLTLARLQLRTAGDQTRSRLDVDAFVQAEGLGNDDVGAALKQVGTLGAVSAGVGLTYEMPLDNSARRAADARARIAVELANTRLEAARQSVLAEVKIALAREVAGRRRLVLAEETARTAKRQLEMEQARFRTGVSTPLLVLEAEDQARSADLRVARARADLLLTNLSIQHLTGRLLARAGGAVQSTPGRVGSRRGLKVGPLVGAF